MNDHKVQIGRSEPLFRVRDTTMHVAGGERHAFQVSPPHAQVNEGRTQRHPETVRIMHFQKRFSDRPVTPSMLISLRSSRE
jgi:hypothetical protein